jgi:histidine triad (HIT) family protein
MSSASAKAKAWLLPVGTAAYGFALTEPVASVALLGVAAVMVFAFLDAHYLRQERAFRALYRDAVADNVAVYEMSTRRYIRKPDQLTGDTEAGDLRDENCRWPSVVRSWSVAGFYGPFLAIGIVAFFIIR